MSDEFSQVPEELRALKQFCLRAEKQPYVKNARGGFSAKGWQTQLGPGRHPISSAMFWYFQSPAGALVEYYTDEDELTPAWQPRDFTPGPTVFAEWAIDGGLDGNTRRQKGMEAGGKFLTDRGN